MSMDVTSLPVERGSGAGGLVLPIDDQLIEVDDHVAGPLGVNGIGEMGQVGSAAVFFALALGTGSTGTLLLILGPLATFAQ